MNTLVTGVIVIQVIGLVALAALTFPPIGILPLQKLMLGFFSEPAWGVLIGIRTSGVL